MDPGRRSFEMMYFPHGAQREPNAQIYRGTWERDITP